PRMVLATIQALIQPVPDRAALLASQKLLRVGQDEGPETLARWLIEQGYDPAESVEAPGQFSRRGGILDIFSPDQEAPVRLEYFGDEIESIRPFAPGTQRSLGSATETTLSALPRLASDADARQRVSLTGHLCEYLPANARVILLESEDLTEQGNQYFQRLVDATGLFRTDKVFSHLLRFPSLHISALPSPSMEATCHLRVESVERLSGDVRRIRDELDGIAARDWVLIACENEAESKRLGEVLAAGSLAQSDRLRLVTGHVRAGFRLIDSAGNCVVLGGQELFHRDDVRPLMPRRRLESRAIDSFRDLSEGDLVVHVGTGLPASGA
ncbi:MAG: transcription-repair coupling factor, partial [Gemmataceae bacterium]